MSKNEEFEKYLDTVLNFAKVEIKPVAYRPVRDREYEVLCRLVVGNASIAAPAAVKLRVYFSGTDPLQEELEQDIWDSLFSD